MAGRRERPHKDKNLYCPRCNSTNTKFCYYNNYSLTQPRYFCKSCRRYWTEGGSLKNVPVGGGSRKNKRSAQSSSSSTKLMIPDLNPPCTLPQSTVTSHPLNTNKFHHHGQCYQGSFHPTESPRFEINNSNLSASCSSSSTVTPLSSLDLLTTGIAFRGLNSYIPTPEANFRELKPNYGVWDTGIAARVGNVLEVQENKHARIPFLFGEMKQLSSITTTTTTEFDQNKALSDENSTVYNWNGLLGGGTW
ncbi:hypothetical protein Nepgr_023598 [Nepenthes gracilis]|uniref:Dof zinc finger protein n=1 Tax=Nepenthes gracilis TaxID=150966 RepID=A0AAD3T4J2_NEPGR|nr:hypothetical protein Nepgr_023598 [Nepenthes gracilis]